MSQASKTFTSRTFNLLSDNIDTDQIIPAQFLTTTSRSGLGKVAFYNLRFDSHGSALSETPFTSLDTKDNSILVGGNNFGCGSSREHAPWALLDMGFKAVISTQIADIFRNNSIKNGLIPIIVDKEAHNFLSNNPNTEVSIDIAESTCSIEGFGSIKFPLDEFSRYCLSRNYDQLDYLLEKQSLITNFEASRPTYLK